MCLLAVTTFVTRRPLVRAAAAFGVRWGLGHSIAVPPSVSCSSDSAPGPSSPLASYTSIPPRNMGVTGTCICMPRIVLRRRTDTGTRRAMARILPGGR